MTCFKTNKKGILELKKLKFWLRDDLRDNKLFKVILGPKFGKESGYTKLKLSGLHIGQPAA